MAPQYYYNTPNRVTHRDSGYATRRTSGVPNTQPQRPVSTANVVCTDKHQYEVIRNLDPRPQVPDAECMSAGIFLVRELTTKKLAVQKRIKIVQQDRKERARAEIDALIQLQGAGGSKHVNGIIEGFWDGHSPLCSIILVYCDAGTIDDLIRRYRIDKKVVPEDFIWHVAAGIAKGLLFLHTGIDADDESNDQDISEWNTICHLDIKPGNVFLSIVQGGDPRYPRVIVGDLGCAVTKRDILDGSAKRMVQHNGTPGWFPPECQRDQDGNWHGLYGKPTDIWQMGGVIQCLCKLAFFPNQPSVNSGKPCGSNYSNGMNRMVVDCMDESFDGRIWILTLVDNMKIQMRNQKLKF